MCNTRYVSCSVVTYIASVLRIHDIFGRDPDPDPDPQHCIAYYTYGTATKRSITQCLRHKT